MKILVIGTDSNKSGASLSMVVLAKIAKGAGIDIRLVIPSHGPLEEELVNAGLTYYVVRSYNWITKKDAPDSVKRQFLHIIKVCVNKVAEHKIDKIIRDFSPDIVHINTICSGVGAKTALKRQKALIWHIREFVEEDHGYIFWNKNTTYRLMKKANLLIAISDCVYRKFACLVDKDRIQTIYNGIDVNRFYYNEDHIFKNENSIQIYMGGSIAESKGQYLLIEAANNLKRIYNGKFVIHILGAGDTKYVNQLKDFVMKNELSTCIYFDGFNDNMPMEWRKADIAVVASRAEAFGRVTVEAMLSGALLIGADTAGTAEIITDMKTGLLFKNGDAYSLAEKMLWAFEHRNEAKEIALCGQNEVRKKYTADKNAKEIMAAYERVYNKTRGN